MLKSPKAKGSRLEYEVRDAIIESGLDPDATRMPLSGAFPGLKGDIKTTLDIHIECKNQEKVKLWEWVKDILKLKIKRWCLIISGNRRPIVAVISLDLLIYFLKIEKDCLNHFNRKEK